MKRRRKTAHFISAAGSGGGLTGWTQPDINWEWWNQVPVNSPGGYLPPVSGPVEVAPPGNAQQVVGYNERGDPIFTTTVTEVRWPGEGEENVRKVGSGTLGGDLYQNMLTGQYFQTPQGAAPPPPATETTFPGGQDPTMVGQTPVWSTDVNEKMDMFPEPPPVIPWEIPTDHPDFGQPAGPSPYAGNWWMGEPPQLPYEVPNYDPFAPEFKFSTDVYRPQDIEPIPSPIPWPYLNTQIPGIDIPVISRPFEPIPKPPGGKTEGPTIGWNPPKPPPPPPETKPGGGGGGGTTEKPKPKDDEKAKAPVLPYVAPGAPQPGAFAPMVGPQGYQSIFGGPLVSREPQYAPMLNMLLRGIGR